ncbi:MAG TPA: hypothetical protein VNJ08_08575 [Bacteriovoracaceae bacterium]|nr:hypothetical protein [Bacteriovoracaceae bacterium]
MKNEKDKKEQSVLTPMYHEGHTLKTRRDFLSQGFLGLSAFTLAPTALSMLTSGKAYGAECAIQASVSGMIPVIILDLSGGGNIPGSNVMVGGAGGQLDFLADYSTLGLPPEMHPSRPGMLDTELGLVFHSDSGMLRGIKSVTNASTRSNVDGLVWNTVSSDDTNNNEINPAYWIHKAGIRGRLNQIVGSEGSDSGGNSRAPSVSVNPSIAPVRISGPQDAVNLVSLERLGTFFAQNKSSKVERILRSIAGLSQSKLESISRRSLPEEIKELVKCGFQQAPDQIRAFSPAALDPRLDPLVTPIFADMANNSDQRRVASIAKLVLDRYSAVGVIEKGGFDYHTGNRSEGERRDFEAGQVIGRIMQLAAAKQTDVMIYVFTDGGVAATKTLDNTVEGRGKYIWTGDSGQRSSSFMLVYKASGKPALVNANRQIGYFKANGSVETSALITSNSVVNLAKSVTSNYMALHGLDEKVSDVIGEVPFGTPDTVEWKKYVRFTK